MQLEVLVLVGLPGSGKSTFAAALLERSKGQFVRVCQDVLKTKQQCEKAAVSALARGLSPIIDRTNVDTKQREPWVSLAKSSGVDATAVFFNVTSHCCMERVKARVDHETNPPAFVVSMMKGRLRAPTAAEGFKKVVTVVTPDDVERLVARVCGAEETVTTTAAVDLAADDALATKQRPAAVDLTCAQDDDGASRPRKRSKNAQAQQLAEYCSQNRQKWQQPSQSSEAVATAPPSAGCSLREIRGDLFSASPSPLTGGTTALCHCVSRDMAMGKGIAVHFKRRFGGVAELKKQQAGVGGVAFLQRDLNENGSFAGGTTRQFIYYLVTKERYWNKPTIGSLRASLIAMRELLLRHGVIQLAMPRIGCGLDGLQYLGRGGVKALLLEVFAGTGVDLLVHTL